ncbi:MAG: thioesterase family protein [Halobacteriales archaeon]|nr:thioesterase family protein [Halobacteriales archaeon]
MAAASPHPTVWENRVRFAETDQQGIVFYGTFFTYQDETLNQFFRDIGYPYRRMEENGFTTHIVHAELDYRQPARFEDQLRNSMRVTRLGTTSFDVDYRARRTGEEDPVVEGGAVHVTADVTTGEAVPIPADFREAVRAFQDEPPNES